MEDIETNRDMQRIQKQIEMEDIETNRDGGYRNKQRLRIQKKIEMKIQKQIENEDID